MVFYEPKLKKSQGAASATMAMEGMPLTGDEKEMLHALQTGKISGDELRQRVITSIRTKAAG